MDMRTVITMGEMLKAGKNKEMCDIILKRIEPFMVFISGKIYHFYGAKYDSSISFDDIKQFVTVSMIMAIRKYNPKNYDKKKDKSGSKKYMNGFSYIETIGKRIVRSYYEYQHRKKRIPPEKITSLNIIIDDYGNELQSILCEPENDDIDVFNIKKIVNKFHGSYVDSADERMHLYDVMKMIMIDDMTYGEVGKVYNISKQAMHKIVKNHIVKELKRENKQRTAENPYM